jgi:hypothetical protein
MTEYTDDEMFAQIAKNQRVMADSILSQHAEIERLKFRIDRLERGRL